MSRPVPLHALVLVSMLVAKGAAAGGGPPPGPPEITISLAESFLESLAVADVDLDGTLEPAERVEPVPIQVAPSGTFQETSSATLGGARGVATQRVSHSLADGVLTVTASGDCAAEATLTGDAERDALQASESEQTFLLGFETNVPARFSLSGDVAVTGGTSITPAGTRAIVSFVQGGVDIQADDATGSPQSQNASVSGELPAGGGSIGGGCRTSALRFGDPIPLATARWRLTLTVELPAAGDVFVWAGPQAGAFGDAGNWDPEGPATSGVPSFLPGERSDTALFGAVRARVDLGSAAALEQTSQRTRAARLASRGTAPQCAGPVQHTIGRLLLDSTRELEPVNGTLALNALSLEDASLTLEDNALLDLADAVLCARHAQVGARGRPSIALVQGPGGVLETLGRLSVGLGGEGTLRIQGGGIASSEEVRIGDGSRPGLAVVSDATWQTGNLAVGFLSTGQLLVENAGLVESENGFVDRDLDALGGNVGLVTVRGAGSRWSLDELSIGGFGTVEIEEGGRIEAPRQAATGLIEVGVAGDPGEARLLVNQGGELLTGSLEVGAGGAGRLIVAEAFQLDPRVEADFALFVGTAGGRGAVQLIGDPSTDGFSIVADELQVGASNGASGELDVDFGGKLLTSTNAFVGTDGGRGIVRLLGSSIGAPELTAWQISESLNLGGASSPVTGQLLIRDAAVTVGTVSTPGSVFIDAGGAIVASGAGSRLSVRGGLVTNDGLIVGPLNLDGRYDPTSTGSIVSTIAGLSPSPLQLAARSPAGVLAALGGRKKKPAPPAQGPVVFTGDAELGGTLVLRFTDGFAPSAGNRFEVVEAAGDVIGAFAEVVVEGLAPGAELATGVEAGVLALTSLTDAVALPAVSLKAPLELKEKKKKGATASFQRRGDLSQPLAVAYEVRGSATAGVDYAGLPGTLEIPAGKKSAKLRIRPFRDGIAEATETLVIEVLPGAGYVPSSISQASIELLDAD